MAEYEFTVRAELGSAGPETIVLDEPVSPGEARLLAACREKGLPPEREQALAPLCARVFAAAELECRYLGGCEETGDSPRRYRLLRFMPKDAV